MQQRKKPRSLTLSLSDKKQPFLIFEGVRYTLRNFSDEGFGLLVPPPLPVNLTPGNHICADVLAGQTVYPVRLEIRHASAGLIGLKIIKVSKELEKILRKLMEPATYASSLKKQETLTDAQHKAAKSDENESNWPTLWYVGLANSQLVIWYNPFQNMVQAVQCSWLGKWVYRYQYRPIEVGQVANGVIPATGKRLEKKYLLSENEELQTSILEEAGQFLTALPEPLPGSLLWQFLEFGEQVYLPEELLLAVGKAS